MAILSLEIMINLARYDESLTMTSQPSSSDNLTLSLDERLANAICLLIRAQFHPSAMLERRVGVKELSSESSSQQGSISFCLAPLELAMRLLKTFPVNAVIITTAVVALLKEYCQHKDSMYKPEKGKMLAHLLYKCSLIDPKTLREHTSAILDIIRHISSSISTGSDEDTISTIVCFNASVTTGSFTTPSLTSIFSFVLPSLM